MNRKATITIDVIIPVFNGEKYIREAVQSVLLQTYPPQKIYIIDDGSTDNTAKVVRDLIKNSTTKIEYLYLSHKGVSKARNTGILKSSAAYIAFLDADDVWLPTKLEKQVNMLLTQPDVAFIHCKFNYTDRDLLPHKTFLADKYFIKPLEGDSSTEIFMQEPWISCSSVLVKKQLLLEIGLFDELLSYGEDADLFIRLAQVTHFGFVNEIMVHMRRHEENVTQKVGKMEKELFKYYCKWIPSFPDNAPELHRIGAAWAFYSFKDSGTRKMIAAELPRASAKKVFPYAFGNIYLQMIYSFPFIVFKSLKNRIRKSKLSIFPSNKKPNL